MIVYSRSRLFTCALLGMFLLSGCTKEITSSAAAQADFVDPARIEDTLIRPPNVIAEDTDIILQVGSEGASRLLPQLRTARILRDGSVRWLEIDLPTDEAWQILRTFWIEEGFGIAIDLPEAGVIETDWQQDRSKVLGSGLSRYLDIAFGTLNDTGIRHQFRSRIERGGDDGTSNIYIVHRAIEQGGIGTDGKYSPLPSDRILELEMMRRLMLAFRLPEESIASLDELAEEEEINNLYEIESGNLVILRSHDDAWRLLGLALDRAGFTVKEKDRDSGRITLLTADPQEEEEGFFDTLFPSEDLPPREIELTVTSLGPERVEVVISNDEDGKTILSIVAENL